MNVVIYARFSSHSQTEQSIEGQLNVCHEYARSHGFNVINEYIDRAQSGTSNNRSNFQRMINDSVHHAFQGVLVYQLDRFARNRYDSAIYKARLKKNGVRVMSAKENIADDASGILVEGVLESMAEYYSVELSQKILRGMKINAEKCLSNGSNPGLGFNVDKDRQFYVDPKEAAIVREVFERYSNGETATDIIDDLNDRNIRTSRGNPFNKNSLHRMFRNKRYIGIYTYKDTEIVGGMPRIIDDGLFYRVQDILERNKVAPARSRGKNEYLLTTKLFCGHCGEMMTGYTGTSKQGTRYHYYICNGRKAKRCNKKMVSKSTIEESVINICLGLLTEEKIEIISDRVLIASNRPDEIASIKRLKAAIADADHAIENLWLALEYGQSVEMITERIRIRKQEKEELEKQLAKEELKVQGFDYSQIRAYLYHIKNLPGDDLEKKRALINIFINRIYLYDDHYTLILNGGNRGVELENIPLEVLNSSASNGVSEQIGCSSLVADAPPKNRQVSFEACRFKLFLFKNTKEFTQMKKYVSLLLAVLLCAGITGCAATDQAKEIPQEFADAQSVQVYLEEQNAVYVQTGKNGGDITEDKRQDTAENGQKPYAVIVTCSDSRVPAEHIFNAGIGELFVIRTAGNVIGDHALGSVEYGAEHLGAKLVVVLGHTNCGAVDAALNGGAHGYIATITDEISACIPAECDPREAEMLNVENSITKIMNSHIMTELTEAGTCSVVGAIYDIETGVVEFFDK